jgi:GntR family transcriptional regulator, rspAB operon transcriptional repressor
MGWLVRRGKSTGTGGTGSKMNSAIFADQVYDHILTQIFARELRPGDLLDRKLIAEELEVSLIPVSDAVQRLTHEGLLTTRRRQGTFVSSPGIEDVRGQLLLREALECQSARL